jgi:peptide/nickel transport system permease protein
MMPNSDSVSTILLNARQAMQRGDRRAARVWAGQAAALAPDSEEPWLYLAAVASPPASVHYLEQALKINPGSQRAKKGLEWALDRLARYQAQQFSRQVTPPARNPVEDPGLDRTLQGFPRKTASPVPLIRQPVREASGQMIAHLPPIAGFHLPRLIPGYLFRSLQRFSSRWQNWIGVLLVLFFIVVALTAPWISPNNPKSPGPFMRAAGFSLGDNLPRSPSLVPPLGTLTGQVEVFHALIWGTRDALGFGLEVVLLSAFFGLLFGAIAGYAGGTLNSIMMRITDAFLAFPIIAGIVFLNQLWVSVTVAAGGFFDNYHNTWMNVGGNASFLQLLIQKFNPLFIILILFSWMPYARITNTIVMSLKQVEFIQAARAIGAKSSRIIFRHLLPNSVAPSIVLAARDVGSIVILQATFTFIGLDGSSTWGEMLVLGKDWVLGPGGGILKYWWVYIPATLVLVLFGIGWNLLGDGLSELLDPRDD